MITRLENFVNSDFAQIDYTDAIDVLFKNQVKKFEFPVSWGIDLSSEHERFLAERIFQITCCREKLSKRYQSLLYAFK